MGMLREIFVAVVGGLLSSMLFVYFQRASERAARRRFEFPAPVPAEAPRDRAVGSGPKIGDRLKHVLWFLISLGLVGFCAVVFAALVTTDVDFAAAAHKAPRPTEVSDVLVFLFSIPLFIMSIRAQFADRFVMVWVRFLGFTVVGLFLYVVANAILFGTDSHAGAFPWPDPSALEGPLVGLLLMLELLFTVLAAGYWPHWRARERTAVTA